MPQALALSDKEMDVLYRLAQPIPPRDRGAFLQAVAERLRDVSVLGPGVVARVAREAQRQFRDVPDLGRGGHSVSKYA